MKTTADKFRKKPHDVYAEAARGETITINHDRYRDCVFELTARSRAHMVRHELGAEGQDYLIGEDN